MAEIYQDFFSIKVCVTFVIIRTNFKLLIVYERFIHSILDFYMNFFYDLYFIFRSNRLKHRKNILKRSKNKY